ncbi:hypothetical protein Micbo1qcDRAFT_98358, partial [Microdochium bolleyi]
QLSAGFHGFFWPKVFWDFATKRLDRAVHPVPVLQVLNVLSGLAILALQWPLPCCLRFDLRRVHFCAVLLAAIPAAFLFQSVDTVLYYLVAACLFW